MCYLGKRYRNFNFLFFRSEQTAPPSQLDNEVFDSGTAPPRLKSPSLVSRSTAPGWPLWVSLSSWDLCSFVDLTFSCASGLVMQDFFCFSTCSLLKFSCLNGLGIIFNNKNRLLKTLVLLKTYKDVHCSWTKISLIQSEKLLYKNFKFRLHSDLF